MRGIFNCIDRLIWTIQLPEEPRMNGHTWHGILVGHKKKWFQFSKPRLTIQPRAIACMRIIQKYFLFRAKLTKPVLQIHFLKSWSSNKSTSGDREPPDVGNFETDGDGGQVEELTLLTACYFQWQGGLRVRAGRSEWEDVNCKLYIIFVQAHLQERESSSSWFPLWSKSTRNPSPRQSSNSTVNLCG